MDKKGTILNKIRAKVRVQESVVEIVRYGLRIPSRGRVIGIEDCFIDL